MTELKVILGYLNWASSSAISGSNQQKIEGLNNLISVMPDDQMNEKARKLKDLSNIASRLLNRQEAAEILLHCSVHYSSIGDCNEAHNMVEIALPIYHLLNDRYRQAIASWMSYEINHQSNMYRNAYKAADDAMIELRWLKKDFAKKNLPTHRDWCHRRIIDINTDLLQKPSDIYACLYQLKNPGHLRIPVENAKKRLWNQIESRNISEAQIEIELLKNMTVRSPDKIETAEAYATCGTAHYLLDQYKEATDSFRVALKFYQSEYHQYAIMQWITGIVTLKVAQKCLKETRLKTIVSGINYLQKSICQTNELRIKADHSNISESCEWYQNLHEAMTQELGRITTPSVS